MCGRRQVVFGVLVDNLGELRTLTRLCRKCPNSGPERRIDDLNGTTLYIQV